MRIDKGYSIDEAMKLWWSRKDKCWGTVILFTVFIIMLVITSFLFGGLYFSRVETVEIKKAVYVQDKSASEELINVDTRVLQATGCSPREESFLTCLDQQDELKELEAPNTGVLWVN